MTFGPHLRPLSRGLPGVCSALATEGGARITLCTAQHTKDVISWGQFGYILYSLRADWGIATDIGFGPKLLGGLILTMSSSGRLQKLFFVRLSSCI